MTTFILLVDDVIIVLGETVTGVVSGLAAEPVNALTSTVALITVVVCGGATVAPCPTGAAPRAMLMTCGSASGWT